LVGYDSDQWMWQTTQQMFKVSCCARNKCWRLITTNIAVC